MLQFFSQEQKVILSENYALSGESVQSHFSLAICEGKSMEHNSIMLPVDVLGASFIVGTQHN